MHYLRGILASLLLTVGLVGCVFVDRDGWHHRNHNGYGYGGGYYGSGSYHYGGSGSGGYSQHGW